MRDDRVYLMHIRDAIERIREFTLSGREAFLREPLVQDAVIRNLEVIGEAVKHLSNELRGAHPVGPTRLYLGNRLQVCEMC